MKKVIVVMLLMSSLSFAKDKDEKKATPSVSQDAKASIMKAKDEYQQQFIKVLQNELQVSEDKTLLKLSGQRYVDAMDAAKKEAGVDAKCTLNADWTWNCPAPEAKKDETKK